MKQIILSVVVVVTMTSAAGAEPRKLADAEMASVTGGLYDFIFIVPITVVVSDATANAIGVSSQDVTSNAISNVVVNNIIGVDQANPLVGAVLPVQPRLGASGAPTGWWPWAEPRPGQAGPGIDPLRGALMLSGMLQSRYLGPGW